MKMSRFLSYKTKLFLFLLSSAIICNSINTSNLLIGSGSISTQHERSVVVVDISHGYEIYIPAKASVMGGLLEGTGDFEVRSTLMKTPIDDSILADADVFMIVCPDPAFQYSPEEISVLKNFMSNGGSILFIGEPQSWKPTGDPGMDSSELNRIIDQLGFPVSFIEGSPYYCKTDLTGTLPVHDTMSNLTSFYMLSAPLSITNYTNIDVIAQGTRPGSTFDSFAVFDNSTHRAAFIGTTGVFLEHRVYRDGGYPDDLTYVDDERGDDIYQFQYNIMSWLSHKTPIKLGEYLPIEVYTGFDSPIDSTSLRAMDYYQGAFHFHTVESVVNAPTPDLLKVFENLGHEWIVPTDYNTITGGPVLRDYASSHGSDLVIIDGLEATGYGMYHTTGLFYPNNGTDITGVLDPFERIELFHNQSSPCYLAHPSWEFYPAETDRIWDHDIYPFDGYEIVNSGYLQGNGNLAEYPFYGAPDSHSATYWDVGTVWNYVFADEPPSENPNWLIDAIKERRVVIYSHLGDYYFGDELLVKELIGRQNGIINTSIIPSTTSDIESSTSTTSGLDTTSSTTTPMINVSYLLIVLFCLYKKRK